MSKATRDGRRKNRSQSVERKTSIHTGGGLIGGTMNDIELIKDFWISLRAEEIARGNADPEGDKQVYWVAFEDAHIGADLEWQANYEGKDLDSESKDPLLDKAHKMLARWYKSEDEKSPLEFGGRTSSSALPKKKARDLASRKRKSLGRKASTDLSRIGGMTEKEKLSLIPRLPPDDPIYTGGWVIGGVTSRRSSPNAKAKK